MGRDLIGYGMNPPKVEWPDNARICISVNLAYEEGSETWISDGDDANEQLGEVATLIPPDLRDYWKESYFEYGSRVGVWRILDILDKHDVQGSIFVNARAFERNTEVAREVTKRGHDLVGRGYKWLAHASWDKETEWADMQHSIESLERTSGQRPEGWMVRDGPSPNTYELIQKAGLLYDSHGLSDDIPYYIDVKGSPLLVVPYTIEVNDFRFWFGNSFSGQTFYEVMRDAFDVLYAEGATTPKMMSIGLHSRCIGRPSRSWTLDRFLQYAKSFPGVSFMRRSDIARWWLKNYPPETK